jgi:hypothetical protein
MSQSPADVGRLRARLGRLRARVRAILLAQGAGRLLAAAFGVLVLWFVADFALDLPLGVRRFLRLGLLDRPPELQVLVWLPLLAVAAFLAIGLARGARPVAALFAFLAAGLVGLLVWVAARAFGPLRVRLGDDDLALGVELRYPDLRDRLAGALDFERETRAPSRGESVGMMQAVLAEASEATRRLAFGRAARGASALRWLGAAAGALLVAGTVRVALPEETSLWARRALWLEDVPWPRLTTMRAVDLATDGPVAHEPDRAYPVALGRSLTVYAQALGDVPDEAWLLDLAPGQQPLPRRMYPVPQRPDLFAFEFRDVRRPFAFALQGGDDLDDVPTWRVEITVPPAAVGVETTVTWPEHLGGRVVRVHGGNALVPEGSRLAVRFETSEPVSEARVAIDEAIVDAKPETVSGDAPSDRAFSFQFTAERTTAWRLFLRTPDGKTNDPAADAFEVRVEPDAPPALDWLHPRASVDATPTGRVPLLFAAHDDHGVAQMWLDLRRASGEPVRHALEPYAGLGEEDAPALPVAALDGPLGRRDVAAYLPLDLARLPAAEGAAPADEGRFALRFPARDARGQVRESEWMHVDVRAPARLERNLVDRRNDVRSMFDAIRREQHTRRGEVAELGREPLGRAEADLLKTVRFAQGRIAMDADRAARDLIEVFNGIVYNRVTAAAPTARVLSILDRHHRSTYGRAPEAPDGGAPAWRGDPVFPYPVYEEIVAAWRERSIYDTALLDRMLAVVAEAVEIASHLAPAAQLAAEQASSGAGADVSALIAAQDRVLEALDRLLASMGGWQSLQDLTMLLRGIIEQQRALVPSPEPQPPPGEGGR